MLCKNGPFRINSRLVLSLGESDPVVSRNGDEPLVSRAVLPARNSDGIRDHSRRRLHRLERGEEAGLAQSPGEGGSSVLEAGGDELVDLAGEVVVEDVDFAAAALGEGDDPLVGVAEGGVGVGVVFVGVDGPDGAGDVVAVDEGAGEGVMLSW